MGQRGSREGRGEVGDVRVGGHALEFELEPAWGDGEAEGAEEGKTSGSGWMSGSPEREVTRIGKEGRALERGRRMPTC